ncbi:hypothetical protein PPYR_07560 [Photinus pyralis]|uniref:Lipase n=2 Tax=Photinus pyralis TaxID=7054 RepID=A0A5N4AQS6_PHOPY|nr:lipase 3-like [Photinus pyralis]XP_031341719.1 lipase 3-like [Photinus pyralis]KAB0799679.1 hypothetical protein PPYR_07559 [Photinus pyralis]KAB0799680.1 hypothetical protein PPYR_07560 [Photinus pyralis]
MGRKTLASALVSAILSICHSQVIITKFEDQSGTVSGNLLHNGGDEPDPDIYLTTPQIIRRHGYRSESHVVQTTDGYLLTIHRIPQSKNGTQGKQPVFLQHGLLSSSADFVISDNKSLAFILSDLGYDVWLGNSRGNTYSRAHAWLPTNTDEFWNFTFHEMGVRDLPTALAYVSNVTGLMGDIIYIGHSMGTTMFYSMASTLPEFTHKHVKVMAGLAPVAYMTYITSPIRYFAPFVNDIQWIAKHLGLREFLPHGLIMDVLVYNCRQFKFEKEICEQVIFLVCGFDKLQLDKKMLPDILAHAPAGSSTKTVIHYAQEIRHNGDFMQFDYGEKGNLAQYGKSTPPLYNLSSINVPAYFMYGENDWLADEKDVLRLAKDVQINIGTYKVPFKYFNHVDFLWGRDAATLVYKPLIDIIQRFR